jgi:hypothetical protein
VARKSGAIVLVFGENTNDTKAIATLIQALCPRLAGRVAVRKEPLLLAKGLPVHEVVKKAEKAARALTAEKARGRVDCIFLHEDADDTEPAHEKLCDVKEAALRELGHAVYAVTPAWEIEAWWLLWPDAVASLRASWRSPNTYVGRQVGLIVDAKKELRRLLRPASAGGGFRNYEELDSPDIARIISQQKLARTPQGQSDSYDRFRRSVQDCCRRVRKS